MGAKPLTVDQGGLIDGYLDAARQASAGFVDGTGAIFGECADGVVGYFGTGFVGHLLAPAVMSACVGVRFLGGMREGIYSLPDRVLGMWNNLFSGDPKKLGSTLFQVTQLPAEVLTYASGISGMLSGRVSVPSFDDTGPSHGMLLAAVDQNGNMFAYSSFGVSAGAVSAEAGAISMMAAGAVGKPDNPATERSLGEECQSKGKYAEAVEHYEEAIKEWPYGFRHPDSFRVMADMMERQIECAKRAGIPKTRLDFFEARYEMMQAMIERTVHYRMGHAQVGAGSAEKVLRAAEKTGDPLLQAYAVRDFADAVLYLRQLDSLTRSARLCEKAGELFERAGDYESAEASYHSANIRYYDNYMTSDALRAEMIAERLSAIIAKTR